ncbi:MAG TPA: glycogen-binding domain-containing protein [Longimicrobiales bacterium]
MSPFARAGPGPPRAVVLLALVCAGAPVGPAAAQQRATLDLGIARISQAHVARESALTLAYYLESRHSRLTFASSGIGSLAAGGVTAAQGGIGAFWLLPRSPLGVPELSASLTAARWQDDEAATARFVALRQLWGTARRGAWIGGRAGDVLDGGGRFPAYTAEAGSWLSLRDLAVFGTLSATWTHAGALELDGAGRARTASVPVRFAEAVVRARFERPRFEVELTGTARRGLDSGSAFSLATHAAATWHLSRRLALTVAGGEHLHDPLRGVPETRFATVALRVKVLGGRATSRAAGTAVTVAAEAGGTVRAEVYGAAEVVEVMGEFSDWQPMRLYRAGDTWILPRRLRSGLYRILVRVDGGEWRPPDNLPRAEDEFGTKVGLVVVP